jgi:hypothetical protein
MDQQVILLVERLLAERPWMAPLFFISAALSRRRRGRAGTDPASCCSEAIASGPFVGPYRSQHGADGRDQKWKHAMTAGFIWAKQKSAMGLA